VKGIIAALIFFLSSSTWALTRLQLDQVSNFSVDDGARLNRITRNLETVINSVHFRNLVLEHSFKAQKTFHLNNGDINERVYSRIMSGEETRNVISDGVWNLNLRLKFIFSPSTIAYTTVGSPMINISRRYWRVSSDAKMAGTICHEYMHKVGYVHSFNATPDRPFTVPYGIGSICETVYSNLVK
jgi:hypothetical protein